MPKFNICVIGSGIHSVKTTTMDPHYIAWLMNELGLERRGQLVKLLGIHSTVSLELHLHDLIAKIDPVSCVECTR